MGIGADRGRSPAPSPGEAGYYDELAPETEECQWRREPRDPLRGDVTLAELDQVLGCLEGISGPGFEPDHTTE